MKTENIPITSSNKSRELRAQKLPNTKYQIPNTPRLCRGQTGIEFVIIVGALMAFVSIFLLAIQQNTSEQSYIKENILLKDIALTVQNEINLASESADGYSRQFEIPERAGNLEYEITIDEKIIYIKTNPLRHALTVSTQEVTGDINKTYNTIRKTSGTIYLNQ